MTEYLTQTVLPDRSVQIDSQLDALGVDLSLPVNSVESPVTVVLTGTTYNTMPDDYSQSSCRKTNIVRHTGCLSPVRHLVWNWPSLILAKTKCPSGYKIVWMERDSTSPIELSIHPLIDDDLLPMYLLTEPQYQSIINRMTNLFGEVTQRLAQSGNMELARIATETAFEILRDYDDDAAEAIRWCMHSPLGQPRDIAPTLPEPTIDLPFI